MSQILNPIEILAKLAKANSTGMLRISSEGVSWHIYLERGQIRSAANSVQKCTTTLDYHLRGLGFKSAIAAIKSIPQNQPTTDSQEHNWLTGGTIIPAINWLMLREHLDALQAEQIFISLSKEALETYSWLRDGEYNWSSDRKTPSHILEAKVNFPVLQIASVTQQLQIRLKAWQKFASLNISPYQRPYLLDSNKLNLTPDSILVKLGKLLKGLSFRQLSVILNQDEIKIVQLLFPHIKNGEIVLRPPAQPFSLLPNIPAIAVQNASPKNLAASNGKTRIACVDDSPTILDEIQRFLTNESFEVTKIEDPVKAVPILLRMKPDIILMDISMPNINGYKLCALLRNSDSLNQTPIIMVSGRAGFIDKTRAKLVGATDYLVKPFSRSELLIVVEKYRSGIAKTPGKLI